MSPGGPPGGRRVARVVARLAYWLLVLAISLAIVVGLLLFLESRDASQVQDGASAAGLADRGPPSTARTRRANTTILWAAL